MNEGLDLIKMKKRVRM